MNLIPYRGAHPQIHPTAYIAPTASVAGNVQIGAQSSVWFNASLRGDVQSIHIGTSTNVQDNAVIHVSQGLVIKDNFGTYIGDNVTIGHGAIIHACLIGDGALIGMGAAVLDGAIIEPGAMVAAGAVVSPGKTVQSGWLWVGVPAKPARPLTEAEVEKLRLSGPHYAKLAAEYR